MPHGERCLVSMEKHLWADDKECSVCQCKIGLLHKRHLRHHCRACGGTICSGCIEKAPVATEDGMKVKKVCWNCKRLYDNWQKKEGKAAHEACLSSVKMQPSSSGWVRYIDKATKRPYEHNSELGISRWVKCRALVTLRSVQQDKDCSICLEGLGTQVTEFRNRGGYRTCRHAFHPNCLEKLPTKLCPICREPFTSIKTVKNPWFDYTA